MPDQLEEIKSAFTRELENSKDSPEALDALQVKYLGRKGLLAAEFKKIKDVPPERRKAFGAELNDLKKQITEQFEALKPERPEKADEDFFDLTLPGVPQAVGGRHPLTQVLDEIKAAFISMGFKIEDGPEVEFDYYNFEALNIPRDHPSRDMHDTFYVAGADNVVLRTHTSNVQIRVMERQKPPVRIINPGRVYRKDSIDATHAACFHQIEGLCVDEGVTFAEFKGTIDMFVKKIFGKNVRSQFRPSYFPFTEPSAEVDISCIFCEGAGCRFCKKTGWIEIMGSGMVDPAVFEFVKYDPEKYSGYAFGMGLERIALLVLRIDDIRLFLENDLRFLRQF